MTAPDILLFAAIALLFLGGAIPALGGWPQIHAWTRRWRKRWRHRSGWR